MDFQAFKIIHIRYLYYLSSTLIILEWKNYKNQLVGSFLPVIPIWKIGGKKNIEPFLGLNHYQDSKFNTPMHFQITSIRAHISSHKFTYSVWPSWFKRMPFQPTLLMEKCLDTWGLRIRLYKVKNCISSWVLKESNFPPSCLSNHVKLGHQEKKGFHSFRLNLIL